MSTISKVFTFSLLGALALVFLQAPCSFSQEFKYVGNKKCIGCHRVEYKAWQGDYHAKAMDDLKPGVKADIKTKSKLDPNKDYTADASCLPCHATGYGKPAEAGADLSNVGCESCHGPGSAYKSVKIMNKKAYQADPAAAHQAALAAGLVEPTEKLCVECHNDKSPTWKGFDYAKMIEDVKHK
ncbi:MAG TPA: cytochrome c family protein [Thermodesulfobacteriota bacterium]|nr:cytochrome c family protein [Deltaproteobacteria bacterium]HOC38463.1 cytochrome c family protein [Thermodesulfobacteriota bacterium]HQQ68351.1 cytochrome c family protein [Candidatus Cloacimonadota bacterium]